MEPSPTKVGERGCEAPSIFEILEIFIFEEWSEERSEKRARSSAEGADRRPRPSPEVRDQRKEPRAQSLEFRVLNPREPRA